MGEETPRAVWVTGGGSGIGRVFALRAAARGWRVAVSGRSLPRLDETAAAATGLAGSLTAVPLDVADTTAVAEAGDTVAELFGRLDAVVHAAGLNSPRRRWADQSLTEVEAIVRVNLVGAVAVLDAALPHLRATGGQAVLISSQSAWTFNRGAGVAYGASKAGLSPLCRALNDQEHEHGVRATCLYPGDVATDFLRHRPAVPDDDARSRMLTPDDVARTVEFVLDSPPHVRIDELVVTPLHQV